MNSIFINFDCRDLPNRSNIIRIKRGQFSTIKIENDEYKCKENECKRKDLSCKSEYLTEEKAKDSKKAMKKKKKETIQMDNLEINNLKIHVPKWGANITYKNHKVFLSNTCTIDNFLLALWVLYKKDNNFLNSNMNNKSKTILRIVNNIDQLNWDMAREIWVNDIMKYNEVPIDNTISLFGSDRERFYSYLHIFQEHTVFQLCSQNCDENHKMVYKDSVEISFQKRNNIVELFSGISGKCSKCKSSLTSIIRFKSRPPFLYIQSAYQRIFINEIPKVIQIDGLNYRFLCSTVYKPGHFVSIFDLNQQFFIIDDLDQSVKLLPAFDLKGKNNNKIANYYYKKANTVSSFYYLDS